MTQFVKLRIHLPLSDYNKLFMYCIRHGKSMSGFIRDLIRKELTQEAKHGE
jgi:hypothetical protein